VLTRAVALLGLSEHAQTKQDLETLEQFYAQSPRGSDIRKVRDTVNRMLGEAPAEPSEQMPSKQVDAGGDVGCVFCGARQFCHCALVLIAGNISKGLATGAVLSHPNNPGNPGDPGNPRPNRGSPQELKNHQKKEP